MEMEPTLVSEEIQPSLPQSMNGNGIIASEDKERGDVKESTEKRKREDDDEKPLIVGDGDKSDRKNSLWKTSLCSYFRRQPAGICSHGDACRYAHGEAELRPRPDKSWDPTSERAQKIQKLNGSESDSKAEASAVEDPPVEQVDLTTLDKCLIGLPRKWASDKLESFLDGQGILYKSAKKKKNMTVGFVVFENAEQLKNAITVLNEKPASGKQIKVVDAIRKTLEKKRMVEISERHSGNEDTAVSTSSNLIENSDSVDRDSSLVEGLVSKSRSACDAVAPHAHMSYSDQLEHKKNSLLQTLKRLTRNARKACPNDVSLPDWIMNSREIGGLPCKFEGILPSPLINGYRNKCEFSVGHSLQGKRTVGYMLGNFREGITAVEEPVNCPNVSRISCKYASIFQEFLQSSELPVWNRINNTGFWRQFTVREGRNRGQVAVDEKLETAIAEVMLIIQVCSSGVDKELMENEYRKMAQALAQGATACSPQLPLTTIVVQDHVGISNAASADCPLLPIPVPEVEGQSCAEKSVVTEPRIHDYISNLRFCISPTAFFQVNTLAAERLYSLAGDWAELSPDTLLFDVCCGTGTIGLTLAHRVGMVIGIEMNASAVSDAHRNAEINGIKNCKFVCGKAEDVMGPLLKEYLGVPHQDSKASVVSGSFSIDTNQNVETDATTEKKIQLDSCVVHGTVGAGSNSEVTLSCSESRTIDRVEDSVFPEENPKVVDNLAQSPADSSEEKGTNGSLSKEGSSHETDGVKASAVFLKSCTTECSPTGQENADCSDADQENQKCEDARKENAECRSSENENGTDASSGSQFRDVVAIVDPPRVGLHPTVIKSLRTHPRIRRLVYISCNPESLVANAIELCTPTADNPEKVKGNVWWRNISMAGLARQRTKSMPSSEPFRPVRATAVDLFPHTPHCEMVMLLER